MKLLPRIALAVLLPLAVGSAVTTWVTLAAARREQVDSAAMAQRQVEAHAARLGSELNARLRELRLLAATPGLAAAPAPQALQWLQAWQRANPAMLDLGLIDVWAGQPMASTAAPRPALAGAGHLPQLRGNREVRALVLPGPAVGAAGVVHLVPLPAPDGAPRVALWAALALAVPAVGEEAAAPGPTPVPALLLLDGAGSLLDGRLGGASGRLPQGTATAAAGALARLSSASAPGGPEGRATGWSVSAPGLPPQHAFSATVPGTDWRLWALYEQQVWDAAHGAGLRRTLLLLAGTALAVGLLIGLSLHQLVLRPVARLDQALRRFGEGESEVRLADTQGADELRRLGQAFNTMADAATASERRLHTILEALPFPVALSNLDDHHYVFANAAFERQIGRPRERIVGRPVPEVLVNLDVPALAQLRRRLLSEGSIDEVLTEYRDPQGRPRWWINSARLLTLGTRQFVLAAGSEVTQLKQVELQLRRSEAAFMALFDLAPLPLAYSDSDSGFTRSHFNQAWFRVFGYTPQQAEGQPGPAFGLWQDPADRDAYARHVEAGDGTVPFEARLRHADGRPLTVWMSGRLIELAGRRLRITAYLDVTEQQRQERRLRQFEAMVASASDAMILLDGSRFAECNEATARLYGVPREALIGRSAADFSPPLQPDGRVSAEAEVALITAAQAGTPQRFDWLHQRPDGTQRFVEVTLSPVGEPGGSRVVATLRDFTERRAVEEALRESNELFSRTFDLLPEALALIRSTDGRYVDVNRAWELKAGYSRADAVGRTGIELGLFDNPADLKRLASALHEQREFDALPVVYRSASGKPLPCEVSVRRLLYRGEDIGIWLVRDMSERQAAAQRYRQLYEGIMDGYVSVDLQGRMLHSNSTFRAIVARSEAELQATSFWTLTPERWHAAERDILRQQVDQRGYSELFEKEYLRPDGSLVPVELRAHLERDVEGRHCGYWAVVRDITQRKRAEEQLRQLNATLEQRVQQRTAELAARNEELAQAIDTLQRTRDELVRSEKLASLGALVAGVAHELNTPVGNAVMVASTIADRQRELDAALAQGLRRATLEDYLEVTREGLLVLERNLARAGELIGSFKQLATDQSSDQRRRFSPDEVINGVLLALSPRLRRANVRVQQRLAAGLQLDSYPGALSQVLENLLLNAVVHGFDGRPGGLLRLVTEADGDDAMRLIVEDDGLGMSPEVQRRIFDPFFTTRLGSGGSGLGLHIVYTLISGPLGGRIDVHSAPGQGSRFVISLPLVAPTPAAPDAAGVRGGTITG